MNAMRFVVCGLFVLLTPIQRSPLNRAFSNQARVDRERSNCPPTGGSPEQTRFSGQQSRTVICRPNRGVRQLEGIEARAEDFHPAILPSVLMKDGAIVSVRRPVVGANEEFSCAADSPTAEPSDRSVIASRSHLTKVTATAATSS